MKVTSRAFCLFRASLRDTERHLLPCRYSTRVQRPRDQPEARRRSSSVYPTSSASPRRTRPIEEDREFISARVRSSSSRSSRHSSPSAERRAGQRRAASSRASASGHGSWPGSIRSRRSTTTHTRQWARRGMVSRQGDGFRSGHRVRAFTGPTVAVIHGRSVPVSFEHAARGPSWTVRSRAAPCASRGS